MGLTDPGLSFGLIELGGLSFGLLPNSFSVCDVVLGSVIGSFVDVFLGSSGYEPSG